MSDLLGLIAIVPPETPAGSRFNAKLLILILAVLIALLLALIILTIARRAARGSARSGKRTKHTHSAWSEAGRRAEAPSPAQLDDDGTRDIDPEELSDGDIDLGPRR